MLKFRKIFKLSSFMLILLFVIISQSACGAKVKTSKTEFYLNTSCTIDIYDKTESEGNEIISALFAECDKYEKLLSRTISTSDIGKINAAKGETTTVSQETAKLIEDALKVGEETNGDFDISVGQLSDLWNFTSDSPKVPSADSIFKALGSVGYKNVTLNGNDVTISNENTHLDLGAVAKGYIADKLADLAKKKGVTSGIINLGGNVVAIGAKPDGSPWKIGIELPYSGQSQVIGFVEIKDKTVVTSGIYERFFEEDGVKYHHVIDPKTGYPKKTDIVSVSILSDKGNSKLCDLYSTSCLLLGKEKAIEFMKDKAGFEYCIIDSDNNIITSDYFNLQK